MNGKQIRYNRLIRNGKMLCVPIDHGVTNENIAHLTDFRNLAENLVLGGATALIVHKGMVRFLPNLKQTGLIIHISGSTEYKREVHKGIICSVSEVVNLGADAVSIHVNLGNQYEREMLNDFGKISSDCQKFGMPLYVMMYIRDDNNQDISNIKSITHAVRIAAELGADIVKIAFNWTAKELKNIVAKSLIPIVIAGGEPRENVEDVYSRAKELMTSGITGLSFGRNVFMSKNPSQTLQTLNEIVFGTCNDAKHLLPDRLQRV